MNDRFVFTQIRAGSLGGLGKGGADESGVCLAVGWAVPGRKGPFAGPVVTLHQRVTVQRFEAEVVRGRRFGVSIEKGKLVGVAGKFQVAGDREFAVRAQPVPELVPVIDQRPCGESHLFDMAAVSPHAAEIHAACPGPGESLVEKHDRNVLAGKM